MAIIGIDLGTTNSLVSYFKDGKSELIKNVHGSPFTPSVVSVLESGEVIVGQPAKERLYTHPHMTAATFKRFMGTKKEFVLGNQRFTPVELSALVLKSLKADAEAEIGETIEEAIISVPAYFNDQQRRATKQAGELAGLRVERLLAEPTAAALAYGIHESHSDTEFLVFDLGGGTFDVSVVEMFDNIMEVKAVAGDNFLGGEDFDRAIAEYFIQNQGLQDTIDDKSRSIIKEKAEEVKRALTSSASVEMRVVLGDTEHNMTMTQVIFEKISEPILEKIRQPILRALRDARMKTEDLSYIIMVGGSSHIPLIRSYVAKIFGRLPMGYIDPDEAVGLGAGAAAALKERNKDIEERMMTDVCPYTLGTDTIQETEFDSWIDNVYLPIIERNTIIPCSKVVRLYSAVKNQKKMSIIIYQGESRQADQNLKLGELMIKLPPKPKGEAEVDVRYTYDINGLLEVEVTNVETGQKKREVIVNSDNQLTQAEINDRFKRLEALKIHPRDQQKNQLLLARAERLYEELLGEMRDFIGYQIREFETVLNKQNVQEIETASEDLTVMLEDIESQIWGDI